MTRKFFLTEGGTEVTVHYNGLNKTLEIEERIFRADDDVRTHSIHIDWDDAEEFAEEVTRVVNDGAGEE